MVGGLRRQRGHPQRQGGRERLPAAGVDEVRPAAVRGGSRSRPRQPKPERSRRRREVWPPAGEHDAREAPLAIPDAISQLEGPTRGGGRRGRPRPALRRPWSSNSRLAGGGPTRGRPRRSCGGGDELGGRGQLRRREVHERLDAAVRSALRTRPRREQVRKGLRRPVRSSSQSSSSLLGVSGSWSPTCIAGICGRSPARRRAGAASRRTGKRRTATTGGRRSGFRRCRE